ncbi:MAG: TIGR00266 family protein [Dehalococcoidia bacterium]
MNVEILYRPSDALAVVQLTAGESVIVEAGAMVSMSPNVQAETSARGGIFAGLARSMFGGESFFLNTFTATGGPAEITLAPQLAGDIQTLTLNNQTVFVQSGSFLACSPTIEVDTSWGGAKSFFAGEGLVLLRATGSGTLILCSYGAIHPKDLGANERYLIDTGHIVSFPSTAQYRVTKMGGWRSTLLGGEGLVADFTGPGRILLQTRSPGAFLDWLIPRIPRSPNQ